VVCVAGLDVGELLGHLGEYNRLVLLRVLLQDVDHALVPRLCRVRPRPVCDCELQGSASSLTAHTRENVGGMCTCVYARERACRCEREYGGFSSLTLLNQKVLCPVDGWSRHDSLEMKPVVCELDRGFGTVRDSSLTCASRLATEESRV